jgi:hypothetical protein
MKFAEFSTICSCSLKNAIEMVREESKKRYLFIAIDDVSNIAKDPKALETYFFNESDHIVNTVTADGMSEIIFTSAFCFSKNAIDLAPRRYMVSLLLSLEAMTEVRRSTDYHPFLSQANFILHSI